MIARHSRAGGGVVHGSTVYGTKDGNPVIVVLTGIVSRFQIVEFKWKHGAIAQLGERLHGMQEVGGSIPPSSTNYFLHIYFCPHRLEA